MGSAGPASTSFYGTFDQAGNVMEWNEAAGTDDIPGSFVLRGGSWSGSSVTLATPYRVDSSENVNSIYGFRVASIVEQNGDFDFDGDIDGADFLAWQRNRGIGNLSDWQANYGAAASLSAGSTAVPEPNSLLLVVFAIWCLLNFPQAQYSFPFAGK